MSKFLLLTAKKEDGQTKANVRMAAATAYLGYRVKSVVDKGENWELRLEQLVTDKKSSRTRQAAPPPDFLKEKGDSESDAPDDEEASESPEEEAKEDSGEEPDDDAESKDGDKSKGDSKPKDDDPVKAIENIMGELNKLLTDLGGHAQKLKEKADKVDEVHELTKGPDMVDDMGEVPPVPPVDGAEGAEDVGPTPGAGVVPPRRPPVPTGKAARPPMRPPAGVPTFTKKKTKIVEHPIKDNDGEYSIADFLAAIAADPQCEGYSVAEVKTLKEANVYAGKLELAE